MSAWAIKFTIDWPETLPVESRGGRERPLTLEEVVFAMIEPLDHNNVQWYDLTLELHRDPDGSY